MAHKITLRKEAKELLDRLSKADKARHRRFVRAIKKLGDRPNDPKPYKILPSSYLAPKETENVFKILMGLAIIHYQIIEKEKKVIILDLSIPNFIKNVTSKPGK